MDNQIDEKAVYLALKDVFQGDNALLRKKKKIRELILKHLNQAGVKNLIKAHNIENVSVVAKSLLERQIFLSKQKAKACFPEAFRIPSAKIEERIPSQTKQTPKKTDVVQGMPVTPRRSILVIEEDEPEIERSILHLECEVQFDIAKQKHESTAHANMSLNPIYLPYQTQYKLLVKVQQSLERACFDFAILNLPKIVENEDWDCGEAVELNIWSKVLGEHRSKFLQDDLDELDKPLQHLLDSITQLRHTAVHRLRISTEQVELFMADAESLAMLLRNQSCAGQLSQLRHETHQIVQDIKQKMHIIDSDYAAKMKEIAARRVELDRLEQQATADMLKEEQECRSLAGLSLLQVIDSPDTIIISAAASEEDTESDLEASGYRSCDSDASKDD